jgi:leucyl-tRNA synthetase
VPAGIDAETARAMALQCEGARRHTERKEILQVVYVPGRLVNIVVR